MQQGAAEFTSILHPKRGEWPTYYGNLSGNRYTTVDQITPANVAKLQMQWVYPIQYSPLETTPLVVDGVMYVTGPNQVFAIDGRTRRRDVALRAAAHSSGDGFGGCGAGCESWSGVERGSRVLHDR